MARAGQHLHTNRTTLRAPWSNDEEPVLGYVDEAVPMEVRLRVNQAIAYAVSGQGILRDERLPDLVRRVAPCAMSPFALEGYRVDLDLPQNTHEALCAGKIAVDIRIARH